MRNITPVLLLFFVLLFSCGGLRKEPLATCSDKIRNQNETAVDCGGACGDCPTCSDNVQNQDEENIDCGGSCEPCGNCEDTKMNGQETGIDCGGICAPCITNDCSTPVGFAQNGYLPNGEAAFDRTGIHFNGEEVELILYFPLSFPIKQYLVNFHSTAFLNMPVATTQLFEVNYQNENKLNRCEVEFFMQLANLHAQQGQKIYITRNSEKWFNIRFCTLTTEPNAVYTMTTNFSANANFIIN